MGMAAGGTAGTWGVKRNPSAILRREEVAQMQAPLGRYPLGELRTAVSRTIDQPPHSS